MPSHIDEAILADIPEALQEEEKKGQTIPGEVRSMSTEENKALICHFFVEVFSKGDLALVTLLRIDNFQITEGKIWEVRTTLDHQALMQRLSVFLFRLPH